MKQRPLTKPVSYRLPTDTIERIKTMASLHRCSEAQVIDQLVHGTMPPASHLIINPGQSYEPTATGSSGFGMSKFQFTPESGTYEDSTSARSIGKPLNEQTPGER